MMKRAFSYAVLAALLSLGAVFAWADNSARIVRLSLVDGHVTIDRADGQGSVDAMLNMPAVQGAEIRTGDNGYAELEFERGSTVRLTPNSILHIDQLARRDDGKAATAVTVNDGVVYFDLQKGEADTFRVAAAGQQLEIPKQAHFRLDATDSDGEIAVFNGVVKVNGSAVNDVEVKKDETLRFDTNGSPYQLAKNVDSESSDSWDQERSGYRDAYSYRSSPYSGYSSNYVYGLNDLSYWGNYTDVPGWGWMWRPYDVAYNWSPFADGAWVFYPSWGWTWVSAYPWGWAPYRYGQWAFVPNYGWCWQPSPANTWANWHAVPPTVGSSSVIASGGSPLPPRPPRPPIKGGPTVLLVNPSTGTPSTWQDRVPGGRPSVLIRGRQPIPMGPAVEGRTGAPTMMAPHGNTGAMVRPSTRPAPQAAQPRPAAPPVRVAPEQRVEPRVAPAPTPRETPRVQYAPPPPMSRPAPAPSTGTTRKR